MGSVVSFRSPVDCHRDGEPVSPAVRVERPALWKEGACLGGIQVSQLRRHVVTRESVRRWDRQRPPPSRCRPFRGHHYSDLFAKRAWCRLSGNSVQGRKPDSAGFSLSVRERISSSVPVSD